MNLQLITEKTEIESYLKNMKTLLTIGFKTFQRNIGYRGGNREETVYWNNKFKFWWLHNPDVIESSHWFCFGIENPENSKMLSITVEINLPKVGINRKIAGSFLKDNAGNVFITHSGRIGGGRKGITKEAFLEYYGEEQIAEYYNNKESRAIVISSLKSNDLVANISGFVHEVYRIKDILNNVANKGGVSNKKQASLNFTPEFEGHRHSYALAIDIEAQCHHGTVVNQLYERLKENDFTILSDKQIDIYIQNNKELITHIFEVKTALSTTAIYQAIGQLMFHSANQRPIPKRIFVTPAQPNKLTQDILNHLGIFVLVYDWNNGQVIFQNLNHFCRQER